ncbi:MAG TPA: altronate dehydratase family protein [Gemmatimonadaceae bacterium]|nr:altronate dehydratase family protein [Gemmatimonadaceae bacterium]
MSTLTIGAPRAVRVHPSDNVVVAVEALPAGSEVEVDGGTITLAAEVPAGHKIALRDIPAGEQIVKYGFPIGHTTAPVARGEWVHSHNLKTSLEGITEFRYPDSAAALRGRLDPAGPVPTFSGYRRKSGRVGTRNEIWILSTVGCVNHAAERIAKMANDRFAGKIDGAFHFAHPYGCSQLGDDLKNTRRVLAGLMRHPNAGGVLVLGLGCENNQMAGLLELAGDDLDRERLRFFNSQEVFSEVEVGLEKVEELVAIMERDRRTECPASDLVIGNKCGGSDGFSGITANPLVGRVADKLTAVGGGVVLTEVPEMFGAEQVLMNRAASPEVFQGIVRMIDDFKQYFLRHDQPIYENPSPGNKAGGLTTLEEKSLGAIQKGGQATVTSVLRYGERASPGGLSLLEAPGNDGVSSTAMTVSGATVLLFTTGRGTPLGFPVPTIKVSSNSAIAEKKPHWIDFNAGALLDGTATMEQLADELFAFVLDVASGRKQTNNEKHGYREIAIWKSGVTL